MKCSVRAKILILAIFIFCVILPAEDRPASEPSSPPKAWYERIHLRGYVQMRYNRLGLTNLNLQSDQADKSIGDNNSFFLRRARLIFSGDMSEWVAFYFQPDFAVSPSAGLLNFVQIRDLYADIQLESSKQLRIRAGQSKVPFGFENLQSSQNRLPMDRADSVNSAAKDERDIGLFLYWTPTEAKKMFKHLVDSGLKGSGNYGVAGLGVYNGQTANRSETNNNLHTVARLTYPYEFSWGQIVEMSVQAYTGTFTITRGTGVGGGDNFLDQRAAVSLIVYPQPIGLQAEYVVGEGPQLNGTQTTVEKKSLEGGYVLLSYKWGGILPFVRWQYYLGGRKHEQNAPRNKVYETELGVEWQILPELELTAEYTFADRTSAKAPYRNEYGRTARFQLQWNF